MPIRAFALVSSMLMAIPSLSAGSPIAGSPGNVPAKYRALVPHRLLALLHAPEVHEELQLSAKQVADLEALFAQVDRKWFPSRIQPPEEQFPILDHLEQQVHEWLDKNVTARQKHRLRQLEMQAQNIRMLLRSDVAAELKLSPKQQEKLAELATATDAAQTALQRAVLHEEPSEKLQKTAAAALKAEQEAFKSVLNADQHRQLWKTLGEKFDTTKLKRIYPIAPEFEKVEHWINSPPLTLEALRGKVVLVHFYAFQCHNCHANFEIYRRWHNELRSKGVVVIGIQTPETARERDVEAVKTAAAERKLQFPILIDLESANWKAWGNTMWPTVYVIDKKGYLRHWWQGELNWKGATGDKTIEQHVELALAER